MTYEFEIPVGYQLRYPKRKNWTIVKSERELEEFCVNNGLRLWKLNNHPRVGFGNKDKPETYHWVSAKEFLEVVKERDAYVTYDKNNFIRVITFKRV